MSAHRFVHPDGTVEWRDGPVPIAATTTLRDTPKALREAIYHREADCDAIDRSLPFRGGRSVYDVPPEQRCAQCWERTA